MLFKFDTDNVWKAWKLCSKGSYPSVHGPASAWGGRQGDTSRSLPAPASMKAHADAVPDGYSDCPSGFLGACTDGVPLSLKVCSADVILRL